MPFFEWKCADASCHEETSDYRPKWTPDKPPCPAGHGEMVRNWQREARVCDAATGFPFTTSHLTGSPVEVRDAGHLRALLKATGKVQRDDAAFIDEGNFYHVEAGRTDYLTGKRTPPKVVYEQGSGRGNKGQWV